MKVAITSPMASISEGYDSFLKRLVSSISSCSRPFSFTASLIALPVPIR
jgi:hypothetical protein